MCGIAGFLTSAPFAADRARAELARMTTAIEHRGPDDAGHWLDESAGIALGHRRLSIVDLSPLGHQPMISASGRFVIVFNGEIYNYRKLSQELSALGHRFRGTSDTEVLLAAIEEWGVDGTLDRAHGMFAFGVWDNQQRELYLARDRFGEKPLYFSQFSGYLLFASELKAFRAHSEWRGDIDRGSLALLLRHGFIPAPHTVFSNTRKVRPGCVLTVRARGNTFDISEREYWQPKSLPAPGREAVDAQEQVASVHEALRTSIKQQMVADVPLGAFLSGGIDSSLIVSLMQQESSRPVRTFAIGFTEERFNEAPYAKRIAEHLGTDHTELIVTPAEARAVIPRLSQIYDEPFGDSSQIPTFLVCELARRSVTVSLSGDAGDELFGGYARYTAVPSQWQRVRAWPTALRQAAAAFVNSLSPQTLELALAPAGRLRSRPDLSDRLQQHARAWQARSFAEFCHTATSLWPLPDRCVLGAQEPKDVGLRTPAAGAVAQTADELTHMMYMDTRVYLPDDILVKVDRAAMAVSLETRVPFLDPDVAEAAWRIDPVTHRKDGSGKWVLRQILERYVPRTLFERPKKGFSVPVDRWMRSELRGWAEDLLDPAAMRRQGFFDANLIDRRWRQHLSGQTNWQYQLWSVLMFQSWLADWSSPRSVSR
jgi:asparagine synthase (glutamine-hydrolysing)